MKQDEAIKEILSFFPKLYYSIPALELQSVKVGKRYAAVNEATEAILWLLEALETEGARLPSQHQLRMIISKWSPTLGESSRFSKEIRNLLVAKLIVSYRHHEDLRINVLKLTFKGRATL